MSKWRNEKNQIPKIIYLTFLNPEYSRSSVNFQKSNSIFQFELIQVRNSLRRSLWDLIAVSWKNRKLAHVYVVMSPCHILVIILRILTRKKIVLDAGWSMTEATLARNRNKIQKYKSFLIDFLSFHFANLVILESNAQIKFSAKIFKVRKDKLIRLFTGFNEKLIPQSKLKMTDSSNYFNEKNVRLKIIFRGSYNSESGIELIIEAAKKLVDVCSFIIVSRNFPKNMIISSNVTIIDRYLTWAELEAQYNTSILAIGQVSNHPRLQNTIPHKAFEAAYFGKAYLTCDTPSIREIFPSAEDVFYYDGGGVESLISTILEILIDSRLIEIRSKNIRICYEGFFSQEIIRNQMLSILQKNV